MKKKVLLLTLLPLLLSCAKGGRGFPSDHFSSEDRFEGEEYITFNDKNENGTLYDPSNGYSNSGNFLSYWSRKSLSINNGMAEMSIHDDEDGKNYGAEIRTRQGFLYGYFGGRMKPFKKSGTVQSIFTYNGGRYAWDEIDIEFLGKDTTKVQFNYYHNGQGGHEYLYELGFDAAEDFHDYGFLWEENRITWYVDSFPVYRVDASLPQWGFFYCNVWAGKTDDLTTRLWLGDYSKDNKKHIAYYDKLYYSPIDA